MSTSVLLLGHSFVKRFHLWCASNHKHNLNLSSNRIQIYWHGVSGGILLPTNKLKSLLQAKYLVSELNIDVTFVEAGSNDLCDLSLSVEGIVQALFDLAATILNSGSKLVIIAEIMQRRNDNMFNMRARQANALISAYCRASCQFIFWAHGTILTCALQNILLLMIGVHFHPTQGMPRYFMSVRSSLLFAERRLLLAENQAESV
ncbi:hypothetical protein DPMN_170642 [Dreissena polymorpha]|uniref:Uncharacterized protein n=1 Tax=Dreissena polymorpha TaxID=45954 RepID=A0A9D4DYY9_DREPO|nr:hypothetical protein DPMN_170642 [Dreissena polymorpha]